MVYISCYFRSDNFVFRLQRYNIFCIRANILGKNVQIICVCREKAVLLQAKTIGQI